METQVYVQPPKGNIKTWMAYNLGLEKLDIKQPTKLELPYYYIPGLIKETKKHVTIDEFFNQVELLVCAHFNVDPGVLRVNSKKRLRELVQARYFIFWFMQEFTKVPQKILGFRYGKDHATVIHAKKTILNAIETDKIVRRDIAKLHARIEKFVII